MNRRTLTLAFALLFTSVFVGCSEKPESVMKALFEAAAKGNTEEGAKHLSFAKSSSSEMATAKKVAEVFMQDLHEEIVANDGLERIEIIKTTVAADGNSASVATKIHFKNNKSVSDSSRIFKEGGKWKIEFM